MDKVEKPVIRKVDAGIPCVFGNLEILESTSIEAIGNTEAANIPV